MSYNKLIAAIDNYRLNIKPRVDAMRAAGEIFHCHESKEAEVSKESSYLKDKFFDYGHPSNATTIMWYAYSYSMYRVVIDNLGIVWEQEFFWILDGRSVDRIGGFRIFEVDFYGQWGYGHHTRYDNHAKALFDFGILGVNEVIRECGIDVDRFEEPDYNHLTYCPDCSEGGRIDSCPICNGFGVMNIIR